MSFKKGWFGHSYQHHLSRKGIKSKTDIILQDNPKPYKHTPYWKRALGIHEYTDVKGTKNEWKYYELETHTVTLDGAIFFAVDKNGNEVFIEKFTDGYRLYGRHKGHTQTYIGDSTNYEELRHEAFSVIKDVDKLTK